MGQSLQKLCPVVLLGRGHPWVPILVRGSRGCFSFLEVTLNGWAASVLNFESYNRHYYHSLSGQEELRYGTKGCRE